MIDKSYYGDFKMRKYQKCPVCGVYYDFVTNVHCMKEHGRSKKDIEAEFGKIETEKRKADMRVKRK